MDGRIMSTSIAKTEPKKAPVAAGSALRAFVPTTLEEAWRLSGALAQSDMLPKAYGRDPNKVMVGILAGAEVGLTPFVALQSIAVINGNPTMWGDGMLGLVEASGLLEDFEETDDGKTATCRAKRVGRKTEIIRTFSIDDAKTAGLLNKQGPWTQYPKRMRQLRARSFCLRDGFASVLKGIKSAEEVRDYAPMDGGALLSQQRSVTAAMIEDQASDQDIDLETGEVIQEGRATADMGEPHTIDPAELIRLINAKLRWEDVNSLVASHADAVAGYSEEDRARVAEAQESRIKLIKGAAAK
jgi:hypothetical protein